MITDFNNPKSVAYKDVSMETWKKVSNVEVEPWQCYTPETMKESEELREELRLLGLDQEAQELQLSESEAENTEMRQELQRLRAVEESVQR